MGKKRSRNQAKKKRYQRKKKQQSRPMFYVILTVLVVAGAIWGGIELLRQQDEALAGTRVDLLPAGHMPGCTPRYNSTPPTSGCHQGSSAPWGVSDSPIANEFQVHNLEHSGVVVQYRPNPVPGLSDEYIEDLKIFVGDIRQQSRYCKVILAPYPGLDQNIALTSWGWIETFEEFDRDAILKFINDHLEKGPERNVPCR